MKENPGSEGYRTTPNGEAYAVFGTALGDDIFEDEENTLNYYQNGTRFSEKE